MSKHQNILSEKRKIKILSSMLSVKHLVHSFWQNFIYTATLFSSFFYSQYLAILHIFMMYYRLCWRAVKPKLLIINWCAIHENLIKPTCINLKLSIQIYCGPSIISSFYCENAKGICKQCTRMTTHDILLMIYSYFPRRQGITFHAKYPWLL